MKRLDRRVENGGLLQTQGGDIGRDGEAERF